MESAGAREARRNASAPDAVGRGYSGGMLLIVLVAAYAYAEEQDGVRVEIYAFRDGSAIEGHITVSCWNAGVEIGCPATYTLVDPLLTLPEPASDSTSLRTFPGKADQGRVYDDRGGDVFILPRTAAPTVIAPPKDPGLRRLEWQFLTHLPHRYGDVGWTGELRRGRAGPPDVEAVQANGGWYPQLLDDGHVVTATWDVTVTAQDTDVLILNGTVGTGTVRWTGDSDRAALSVIPEGRVHHDPGSALTFVDTPGPTPSSHALGRRLLQASADAVGEITPLTIVQTSDLLHLVRPAPGMVYLSDHTFRLLWLFRPYHLRAVRQAMVEATTPLPSGWDRAFVADAWARSLPAPDLRKTLGWLTWNPVVDALLNDGTLPFYGDLFSETFVDDPELLDLFDGRTPARAASRQLDDLLGPGAALAESHRMLGGPEPDRVPPELRAGWHARYDPDQDYDIVVERGKPVAVVRTGGARGSWTPPVPPTEVVTLTTDKTTTAWLSAGPGTLPLPDAKSVRIDAPGHVDEANRANNRWPGRWDVILSGGIDGLSPTQSNINLWGDLLLRPHGDTHNRALGVLEHDEQDVISASVGYVYSFGPLINRQTRTNHLVALVDGSWLDPSFRPTTSGFIAVGGYVSYASETRLDDAQLSGHRYAAQVSGGFVPGSTDRWASVGASATQLVELAPRHVLALRAKAAWASGEVEHRLLTLGGASDLRSVPTARYLGNEKLIANLEHRVAVFRHAQIPLPLVWATELQLAPGIEWGSVWANDGSDAMALGASLGIHTITDAFGVRPMLFGVTLASPLWTHTVGDREPPLDPVHDMQVYLDFTQGF